MPLRPLYCSFSATLLMINKENPPKTPSLGKNSRKCCSFSQCNCRWHCEIERILSLSQELKQVPSKPPSNLFLSNPSPSNPLEKNKHCLCFTRGTSINTVEKTSIFSQSLEVAQPHRPLLAQKDKEKNECIACIRLY